MFERGYIADAGADIILSKKLYLSPGQTKVVDLEVIATPEEGTMYMLFPRTSAAAKGLYVAPCPIDANYTGNIHAIVTNLGTDAITYEVGEAFCQIVSVMLAPTNFEWKPKKQGKRSIGNFGSTNK